jgi:hypothetical protein
LPGLYRSVKCDAEAGCDVNSGRRCCDAVSRSVSGWRLFRKGDLTIVDASATQCDNHGIVCTGIAQSHDGIRSYSVDTSDVLYSLVVYSHLVSSPVFSFVSGLPLGMPKPAGAPVPAIERDSAVLIKHLSSNGMLCSGQQDARYDCTHQRLAQVRGETSICTDLARPLMSLASSQLKSPFS